MSDGDESTGNRTVPLIRDPGEPLPPVRPQRCRVYLLVAHRDEVVTVPLAAGKSVVIGRESPPADVAIPDRNLSRNQARYKLDTEQNKTVEDLRSTNGIWMDGKHIERATLRHGEELMLGKVAASVRVVSGYEPRPLGPEGHEAF